MNESIGENPYRFTATEGSRIEEKTRREDSLSEKEKLQFSATGALMKLRNALGWDDFSKNIKRVGSEGDIFVRQHYEELQKLTPLRSFSKFLSRDVQQNQEKQWQEKVEVDRIMPGLFRDCISIPLMGKRTWDHKIGTSIDSLPIGQQTVGAMIHFLEKDMVVPALKKYGSEVIRTSSGDEPRENFLKSIGDAIPSTPIIPECARKFAQTETIEKSKTSWETKPKLPALEMTDSELRELLQFYADTESLAYWVVENMPYKDLAKNEAVQFTVTSPEYDIAQIQKERKFRFEAWKEFFRGFDAAANAQDVASAIIKKT